MEIPTVPIIQDNKKISNEILSKIQEPLSNEGFQLILKWRKSSNNFTVQPMMEIYRACIIARTLVSMKIPIPYPQICTLSCIVIGIPENISSSWILVATSIDKSIPIEWISIPESILNILSLLPPNIQLEQFALFLSLAVLTDFFTSQWYYFDCLYRFCKKMVKNGTIFSNIIKGHDQFE